MLSFEAQSHSPDPELRKREAKKGGCWGAGGAGQILLDAATERLKQPARRSDSSLLSGRWGHRDPENSEDGSRPLVAHCSAWQRVTDGWSREGPPAPPPAPASHDKPSSLDVASFERLPAPLWALQADVRPPWPSAWSRGRWATSQHKPCQDITPSGPCGRYSPVLLLNLWGFLASEQLERNPNR